MSAKLYRASDNLLISSEGFRRLVELGVDDKSIHYFLNGSDVMESSTAFES